MIKKIIKMLKKITKKEDLTLNSKNTAKERLHLVLMQDRANVSADFLDLMREEILEVIKKYIEVDEKEIDVRLTNKENEDGTNGAPALYAVIPISNIKEETRKFGNTSNENGQGEKTESSKQEEYKKENQSEDSKNEEQSIEEQNNNENQEEKEEVVVEQANIKENDENTQEEKAEKKS